ncbi:MAG: Crp/Fnr family transcriptional regulator [Desulfobacterales bacterium]|nr:Crp/Fnr family transcriptional regulator [Desulfobacterales bacterium]
MVNLDFLEKSEIFKGLNDDQLAEVHKFCKVNEYQRGDRIFAEGDDSTHLCIVTDGQVDLRFDLPGRPTSEKNTISSISQGGTFQWSSLVPPHKTRLSSYCASKTCEIIQIDRGDLTKLFEEDTKIGYVVMLNLAGVVGGRFHKLQNEIANRRGYETMFSW